MQTVCFAGAEGGLPAPQKPYMRMYTFILMPWGRKSKDSERGKVGRGVPIKVLVHSKKALRMGKQPVGSTFSGVRAPRLLPHERVDQV